MNTKNTELYTRPKDVRKLAAFLKLHFKEAKKLNECYINLLDDSTKNLIKINLNHGADCEKKIKEFLNILLSLDANHTYPEGNPINTAKQYFDIGLGFLQWFYTTLDIEFGMYSENEERYLDFQDFAKDARIKNARLAKLKFSPTEEDFDLIAKFH